MDWLIEQHTTSGVLFQNWMLLALAIIAAWAMFSWSTQSTSRERFYFRLSLVWLAILAGWLLFETFAE
jgi:hypothetical protein